MIIGKLTEQGELFDTNASQVAAKGSSSSKAAEELAQSVVSSASNESLPQDYQRVSNIKLRYVALGENKILMENFEKELMLKVRQTAKILGQKCRLGIVHKMCNQSGYIWTPQNEKITPTYMRDSEDWFKEIWGDCENKGLPTILIEQVINRYQSYKKRNKKLPNYVEFKKSTINIKKNYLKYCDCENAVFIRDLHNKVIKLSIEDKRSVLVHKDLWLKKLSAKKSKPSSELKSVAFAANVMFGCRQIIPIVQIQETEAYRAKGFFAIDINKSAKDWLTFNMPIDGKMVYEKPEVIIAAESRIKKIEKAINDTLDIMPDKRRGKGVKVDHPDFEGKVFKCTSDGRRRLRLYWKDAHKKLQKAINKLDILKRIEKFCFDNKLGFAHDDVASGQQNGTFSQDKLKIYWVSRASEAKFPLEIVNPAYTSQQCPECGHRSPKNRVKDDFKCLNCDYENESHKVGAINIANKAIKAYSNKERVCAPISG